VAVASPDKDFMQLLRPGVILLRPPKKGAPGERVNKYQLVPYSTADFEEVRRQILGGQGQGKRGWPGAWVGWRQSGQLGQIAPWGCYCAANAFLCQQYARLCLPCPNRSCTAPLPHASPSTCLPATHPPCLPACRSSVGSSRSSLWMCLRWLAMPRVCACGGRGLRVTTPNFCPDL